jgi:hypothetical protein
VTIAEFLEARIAEDEAGARSALDGIFDDGVWTTAEDWGGGNCRVHGKGIIIYDEGGHDEEQAAHIARWDPARVLAECAAKRAVISNVGPYSCDQAHPQFDVYHPDGHLSPVLRALAAVYSDHPDYDKDWAL